jgi:hypothetical protein
MFGATTIATLSLAALGAAMPASEPVNRLEARAVSDVYRPYRGDGSTGAGWPAQSAWGSFDEIWGINAPVMKNTCGWNGWGADNSDTEIAGVRSAILQVAGETGVDARFILTIVMQESKGCVRAPTTNNGVVNPGLMQSHNGAGSCAGVNPCPQSQIVQMIRDGTAGTSSGDGLRQTLNKATAVTGNNARAYYAAARMYNSGSVDYSNLNNGFTSTACYSQDVANRFTGWILAPGNCQL